MGALLLVLVPVLLLLLLPPLLLGVVGKTKALFGGRRGPPVLQPYRDLAKLLRKGLVTSSATTSVFLLGPVVTTAATIAAGLLVPVGHHAAPIAFAGDMVLCAYLLALGRFCTAMAAFDTGSPFEGMGATRETGFAWLAEPALFLGFVALARASGSGSLTGMLADPTAPLLSHPGPMLLLAAGWFVVLLAENCRIPFDDPATHLELTMIHEVMVLDHGGPALGIVSYGAAVKFYVFTALLLGVVLPFTGDHLGDLALFVGGTLAVAVLVGTVESAMARLRLLHVPKALVSATLLTGFAVLFQVAR